MRGLSKILNQYVYKVETKRFMVFKLNKLITGTILILAQGQIQKINKKNLIPWMCDCVWESGEWDPTMLGKEKVLQTPIVTLKYFWSISLDASWPFHGLLQKNAFKIENSSSIRRVMLHLPLSLPDQLELY